MIYYFYCILNWAEVFSRITGSLFSVKEELLRLRVTVAYSCLEQSDCIPIRVVGRVQVGYDLARGKRNFKDADLGREIELL